MDLDRGPIRRVDPRAPLDEPRPDAHKDVDLENSRTNTTRGTPRASEMTCMKAVECRS